MPPPVRSNRLSRPGSLNTYVRDVLGVLTFENLADMILVGHSYTTLMPSAVAEKAGRYDRFTLAASLRTMLRHGLK